ncbi:MAG: hypothetical protein AABY22_34460 [Nanoarchaeota archaeon]|mgnify:CR=1 FL=1
MEKTSIKYKIKSYGFESSAIIWKNGDFQIDPYNYTAEGASGGVFTHKITKRKFQNFLKHLQDVAMVKF